MKHVLQNLDPTLALIQYSNEDLMIHEILEKARIVTETIISFTYWIY